MKRRVFASFLVICFILSAATALPAAADGTLVNEMKEPLAGYADILTNGGFEDGTSPWGAAGGWEGDYVSRNTAEGTAHTGAACARVTTSAGGNPYVVYADIPVEEGAEYQATAWFYSTTSNIGFKAEYKNAEGSSFDQIFYTFADQADLSVPTGTWCRVSWTFRPPEGAAQMNLLLRGYASSFTMYVDEVSFYKTDDPLPPEKVLETGTDWVFYYADMELAKAYTKLNVEDWPDLKNALTAFTLLGTDGETVLREEKGVKPDADGNCTWSFPLSALSEKQTAYTVQVTTTLGGEAVSKTANRIYKYDRPARLDKDGDYVLENGKFFDPVIGYHTWKYSTFPYLAEAGINVVQSPASTYQQLKLYLDEAAKYDLKVLLCLYAGMKPAGHPDNLANTKFIVNKLKDHEALFAWAVMDEAAYSDPAVLEIMETSYKTIRDIDPVHPVYNVDCRQDTYAVSAKYCDALAIDPYPHGVDIPTAISAAAEKAVSAAGGEKPVYLLHQTFSYLGTFPDDAEFRNMVYQGFEEGVKGIGYFCIEDATTDDNGNEIHLYESTLWPSLVCFAAKEQEMAFAVFSHDEGRNLQTVEENEKVCIKKWEYENEVYTLMREKTGTAQVCEVGNALTDSVEVIGGAAHTKAENKKILCTIPAEGALLYKTKARDEKGLAAVTNGSFEESVTSDWSLEEAVQETEKDGNSFLSLPAVGNRAGYTLYNLEMGGTWRVRFDYKAGADYALRFTAVNKCRTEEGIFLPAAYTAANGLPAFSVDYGYPDAAGEMLCKASDTWQTVSLTFITHPYANCLELWFQAESAAGVGIDNVIIEGVGENAVKNGGFEGAYMKNTSGNLAYWYNTSGIGACRTDAEKNSGTYSLAIPAGKSAQYNFAPAYGETRLYELSFFVKSEGQGEVQAVIEQQVSPAIETMYYTVPVEKTGRWEKKTLLISGLQTGTAKLSSAGIRLGNTGEAVVYIDDVVFHPLSAAEYFLIDGETFINSTTSGGIPTGGTHPRGSIATEKTNALPGDTVTVYMPVCGTAGTRRMLTAAVYREKENGEKEMTDAGLCIAEMRDGEFTPLLAELQIPEDENCSIRAFLWDMTKGMVPVAEKTISYETE